MTQYTDEGVTDMDILVSYDKNSAPLRKIGEHWLPEELSLIKKLRAEKKTGREIAQILYEMYGHRRTENAVLTRLRIEDRLINPLTAKERRLEALKTPLERKHEAMREAERKRREKMMQDIDQDKEAGYEPEIREYRNDLRRLDWFYDYSDDPSIFRKGAQAYDAMVTRQRRVDPDRVHWDEIAPEQFRSRKVQHV